jgi:anti-sigma B factor antagonist
MNLSIAASATGSTVRLSVSGDIDAANVGQLHDAVTAATTHSRPSTIVLDVARVGFIDSAGIGVLVACHKLADVGGCALRLANLSPFVHRQLFATGTLGLFGCTTPAQETLAC